MLRSLATKPKSRHPIFTTIYPQITPQDPTLYTLTPECLPSHPIFTTTPPQITPQDPILHTLTPECLPGRPISPTTRPQITPSGLVSWQGRVKVRSGLTLPNAPPHWQPLRVGLSKNIRLPTLVIFNSLSDQPKRYL